MAETKTIATLSIVTDSETSHDKIGDVCGGFDEDQLRKQIESHGHAGLCEQLTWMNWQVWDMVRTINAEKDAAIANSKCGAMTEKYYTPYLNEFHIGFDYEIKSSFADGTVKTRKQYEEAVWVKEHVNTVLDLVYIERMMTGINSKNLPSAIRVKLLDKEDIESMGWQHKSGQYFERINTRLRLLENQRVRIENILPVPNKDMSEFYGEIKNKNELKKLMVQLEIPVPNP